MTDDRPVLAIRDATERDDLDALNAGNPDWQGEGDIRGALAGIDAPTALLVAEYAGRAVGYAHAVGLGVCDGHRGMVGVFVAPGARGLGVGTELWSRCLTVCSPDRVPGVLTSTDAADTVSIGIALRHGLHLGDLHLTGALDLVAFDRDPRPPEEGVVLAPVAADDEERWATVRRAFHRLSAPVTVRSGVADGSPDAAFRRIVSERWQLLGAWAGDDLIGLTSVTVRDPATRTLNTLFTAVDPARRGHGLAAELKAQHALALRAAGWRTITTQNLAGNTAILATNARLGFTRTGGSRDLTYDHPA